MNHRSKHTNHTMLAGRRGVLGAAGCLLLANLCGSRPLGAKPMQVILNVVLFNYLDRPVLDVFIDGKAGESSDAYPHTGGGTILNVPLELGPKKVTWRLDGPKGMARNGETVSNRNPLQLTSVLPGARYLAIHLYPDDTVELTTSVMRPEKSARGQMEAEKRSRRHG